MSGVLVWMDLEMTGLDPDRDRIIEIATLVTDDALNVLAEGPNIAVHQPDEVLDLMDAWNQRTHGASGLTDRVRASVIGEEEAEQLTLDFIKKWASPRSAPLAGNSVHQDRRFLARYMTQIEAYLHYRIVDVSSIKELTQRWYPEAFAARPPKSEAHMALDDIYDSVKELKYYRAAVFK